MHITPLQFFSGELLGLQPHASTRQFPLNLLRRRHPRHRHCRQSRRSSALTPPHQPLFAPFARGGAMALIGGLRLR
ncbi:hypothetical protein HanRHA438_Chr06g0250951 [Helianthus annuus]|uniref:Uncharacterized protein n=1 Tax=Helianthus annuus TaxID=4232 RepID=A0A9K3IQ56_HELAN|nr:hypothetical protein HanXRQr2_Chr06g0241901 [Helianthus annuus]KAJ0565182.1 hypothetical protein HanIR_Chr06g0259781 [Helianthus annuus]KAJ0910310.1 hypothetical protein HanRHA438_Chr06g0250951 [Helianthus annuus]